MYSAAKKLFDVYGESVLKELHRFPEQEVIDLLNSLPIEESRRIDFYDQAWQLYAQCSADAFVIGLHLGLSLIRDNVRRPGPEKP